jgi:hypothetical protein
MSGPPLPVQNGQAEKKISLASEIGRAVLSAAIVSAGEAAVGLIPLMSHLVVANFSRPVLVQYVCAGAYKDMNDCHLITVDKLPLAEMDILAVVISGLGLITLFRFGETRRQVRFTPMTYLTAIAGVGLLILGSLLYSFSSAGISANDSTVTIVVLILSVVVSFYLALEEAWLKALEKFD